METTNGVEAPERKPGELARKVAKREAADNAPASLPDMLGYNPGVTLADGKLYRVFHVKIGQLGRFNELIGKLGDYGLVALSGGNPEIMQRALHMPPAEGPEAASEAEAMEIALMASVYALDTDACGAIVDLAVILLNGAGQEVTSEQAGELVDTDSFPLLVRAAGLPDPRPPRPAAN